MLCLLVVDARDALVGVGLILHENGNFCFDKGMLCDVFLYAVVCSV